ncbi:photosynthetic reaction center cytochrome c subunit [Limimaricola pyoseonensis]|uniref:Photosynthetic reaction center cytochrome c subunit n=1 Tax=Limimaricola pyoseonensis TaxID=521013 RepID=A0A1G7B0P2_9RHOB|nr:photosynthetic reaction center cytochrome c subunit [Limimaricola pyoseonensis]
MFPKWFMDWNRSNPTDIYRPGIAVGVVGGAIFVTAMLLTWGWPYPTQSLQTGPRGTGMSVTEFQRQLAVPDPDRALVYDNPPFIPEPGEPLAGEVYENVLVLDDLTEANFLRVMTAITDWVAPEQGCAYCHGDGGVETYGEDNLYTKVVARRMLQMTRHINESWDAHVNANKQVGVTCLTCHRGEPVPSGTWFLSTPTVEAASGWAAVQNRATEVSQSTSLPSDALEKYLLEGEIIAVHDLSSRVENLPGDPLIQQTERTYSLMNYIDNSLGVNCLFCHNSRAFYDPAQVTPQWATASLGIIMALELNTEYLVPLGDLYPPERLGPLHADAPKVACLTCHKGYQQPLQGLNVIADYPELATTGAPVYEAAMEAEAPAEDAAAEDEPVPADEVGDEEAAPADAPPAEDAAAEDAAIEDEAAEEEASGEEAEPAQ